MEKHLSTERLVPRPAAGPGRVARLGRGPLSWCVHSNDVAGYHQHRPGTIMGSHTQNWLEILYGMVMMVHALYLFCVVINGRAFIWMWTIVSAHESSWSISWPPAPSCPVQGWYSGPRGREPQLSCSFIFNQGRFWLLLVWWHFQDLIWNILHTFRIFHFLLDVSVHYPIGFWSINASTHLHQISTDKKLSSGLASILLNYRH